MPDFVFAPSTGRYRGEDGRLVAFRAVRDAVDRTVDEASARLGGLAEQLRTDKIALADWQTGSMAVVRDTHLAAGIAAHGGTARMDQETWGAIGRRIRDEYGYLRDFAQQVTDGAQPLNGRLAARARLYGQAARATYEAVAARDDVDRGMTEERNVLSPSEHCDQCHQLAALGWVPIGTLPSIGARTCRANDRCSIRRRVGQVSEGLRLWSVA